MESYKFVSILVVTFLAAHGLVAVSGIRVLNELQDSAARRILEDNSDVPPAALLALIADMSPPPFGPASYPGSYPSPAPPTPPPVYFPQPSPTPSPTPQPSPSPSASSPPPPVLTAPLCSKYEANSEMCISINATFGTPFDSFKISAFSWRSTISGMPNLMYEFGVILTTSAVVSYKIRQPYSNATSATLIGLPVGITPIFVCVRSVADASTTAIGPNACANVMVNISAQVTAAQITEQMTALENDFAAFNLTTTTTTTQNTTGGNIGSTPAPSAPTTTQALAMTQRLAAILAVSGSTTTPGTTSIAKLSSSLLSQLVFSATKAATSNGAGTGTNDTSGIPAPAVPVMTTSQTLAVFEGVNTLWSMAGDGGRAAVVSGVSSLSEQLASQPLAAEDAQPVFDFLTNMLDDSTALVAASAEAAAEAAEAAAANQAANNATGTNATATAESAAAKAAAVTAAKAAAKVEAAKKVLTSVTRGAAALTRGLLNAAPADGTPVRVATARLSATVQRASAALAANGVTVSVPTPSSSSSSTSAGRRLMAFDFSPVGVIINPAVSSLCTADTTCAASGFGVAVTVMADTALLITSLGGTAAPLTAGLSDYRTGGSVQIISPIVRITAPGLPASALGLASLLVLDLPLNVTAVALNGATTKRALVRLQDFNAATADASAGIASATSITRTSSSGTVSGAVDLISGFSDSLGDFVVLQYTATAVLTAGNGTDPSPMPSPSPTPTPTPSPSPLPSSPPPSDGTAGTSALPSALVVSSLVGLVSLLLTLLA